jgi:hypothetical protein
MLYKALTRRNPYSTLDVPKRASRFDIRPSKASTAVVDKNGKLETGDASSEHQLA